MPSVSEMAPGTQWHPEAVPRHTKSPGLQETDSVSEARPSGYLR